MEVCCQAASSRQKQTHIPNILHHCPQTIAFLYRSGGGGGGGGGVVE